MKLTGLFNNTFAKLEKTLDIRARKHEVILSNIANADTPNFKAFDIVFKEEIVKGGPRSNTIGMTRTHDSHLTPPGSNPHAIIPKRIDSPDMPTFRGDGNTVDIDVEMGKLSKNDLMYSASTQILASKFQSLKNVIKGGQK
ncbi:MAG: flagellar basal body rod protein FlgB [Desulfobacteraceae bacterium]|nr:flagellar basal body rod protein FlgB [Desulfobacteraceae bacterium]